MSSPDVPRLALEHFIGQLTDEVRNVLTTQGGLRGLVRANAAVVEELSLPVVLRHVVEGARDLVHARYGAVGVVGPDGRLEQLIHSGMDNDVVVRIGDPPTGQGILGLLISHPDPVRLTDLRAHPAAVGFPAGHPPMASFLGVPIRVRGQVFGNLYLADSTRGEFTADDEQVVIALAGTAGVAIANARLYEQTMEQHRWQDAAAELTNTLLEHSAEPQLDMVVRLAMHAASADMATFSAPITEHTGRVDAAAGLLIGKVGQVFPLDHTLAGSVIRSGTAALVRNSAADFDNDDDLPDGAGTVIGVPLPGPDATVRGALVVARTGTRARFTENDRDHLIRFAVHAGSALDGERAREEHETLLQIEDHDRIAADLHDHVIQEPFATGMGLQGMLPQLAQPAQRARVLGYIDTLDDTIRTIRNTIYQLHTEPEKRPTLTNRLIAILTEQTDTTGLAVTTEFSGPLNRLPTALDDDIIAVQHESVSNTVRHAAANTVTVKLTALENVVTLEVTDNGVGIGHPTRCSGLANMRRRAENHDGALRQSTPPGGGTHLTWTARHPHPDAPDEAA